MDDISLLMSKSFNREAHWCTGCGYLYWMEQQSPSGWTCCRTRLLSLWLPPHLWVTKLSLNMFETQQGHVSTPVCLKGSPQAFFFVFGKPNQKACQSPPILYPLYLSIPRGSPMRSASVQFQPCIFLSLSFNKAHLCFLIILFLFFFYVPLLLFFFLSPVILKAITTSSSGTGKTERGTERKRANPQVRKHLRIWKWGFWNKCTWVPCCLIIKPHASSLPLFLGPFLCLFLSTGEHWAEPLSVLQI